MPPSRKPLLLVALMAAALPACATMGDPPAPPLLSHVLPTTPAVTYAFEDSSVFSIDPGAMGAMEVVGVQEGVAELEFRQDSTGALHVLVGFPRLNVQFRNPGQGAVTADQGDIAGRFTVNLGPAGMVAVTDTPALTAGLRDVTGVESLLQPLFVRLPDLPVEAGASWTDTVTSVEHTGGLRSETWQMITSTLMGDTTVAGRTLLRIRTEATNQIEVTGTSGGVEILQRVSGDTRGEVLWDPEAGVLYSRREEGELDGTIDLPGLGASDLSVSGRVARRVVLQP